VVLECAGLVFFDSSSGIGEELFDLGMELESMARS
jgi:hypothetical protein